MYGIQPINDPLENIVMAFAAIVCFPIVIFIGVALGRALGGGKSKKVIQVNLDQDLLDDEEEDDGIDSD